MKRRLSLLILMLVMMFTLTGCTDTVNDAWAWISELLTTFINEISCYLYQIFIYVAGLFLSLFTPIAVSLIGLLPIYTPSPVSLSSYTFMSYAAYVLPISEAATLVEYLLLFYTSYFGLRFILRWLKVVK